MKSLIHDLGHRYMQSVRRYYFTPGYAQSINIFRVLFCSMLAIRLLQDATSYDHLYAVGQYNPIQIFQWFGIPKLSTDAFAVSRTILVVSLFSAAIGFFTRTSLTVAWLSFLVYIGAYLGLTKTVHSNYLNHTKNICVVMLWILSAAPGIAMWGVDGLRKRGWRWKLPDPAMAITSHWPVQLCKLAVCMAYFGAGYTKFIKSGILWADGYTLQAYLLNKHLLMGIPEAQWLSEQYWLCVGLSAATLVVELGFFLMIFFPRLQWFFVVGALSMHLCIEYFMHINFFPYFGYVYFIFLDWPTVQKITAPLRRAWYGVRSAFSNVSSPLPTTVPPVAYDLARVMGETKFARRFVLGMAFMLIGCIVFRIERWPFTDYRVYQSRHHYSRLNVYRVAGVNASGKVEWLERSDLPSSPTNLNRRLRDAVNRDDAKITSDILGNVVDAVGDDSRREFDNVALVRRTVQASANGKLQIKNEVLAARPLNETAVDKPAILQAWLEAPDAGTIRR